MNILTKPWFDGSVKRSDFKVTQIDDPLSSVGGHNVAKIRWGRIIERVIFYIFAFNFYWLGFLPLAFILDIIGATFANGGNDISYVTDIALGNISSLHIITLFLSAKKSYDVIYAHLVIRDVIDFGTYRAKKFNDVFQNGSVAEKARVRKAIRRIILPPAKIEKHIATVGLKNFNAFRKSYAKYKKDETQTIYNQMAPYGDPHVKELLSRYV